MSSRSLGPTVTKRFRRGQALVSASPAAENVAVWRLRQPALAEPLALALAFTDTSI